VGLPKAQRLRMIVSEVNSAAPFKDGKEARFVLAEIMRSIENQHSGVPENPGAADAATDGRMYPPDDMFESASGSPRVRLFRHLRHRTFIGENGALRIVTALGHELIDVAGRDGRTVNDLLEVGDESD
jgi:hypothetical protein